MKKIILVWLISVLCSFTPPKQIWVALGDSITYLNNHSDETGNRITKGYMTMLTEQMPDIEYINHGYNGWTAVKVAEKIEELKIPKADIYTVFLGTNDWWNAKPLGTFTDYQNNTGSATFYGAYRIIIDKLRYLNKDAKITLITPMQRVDFVYINNMKNNAFGSYKAKNGQTLEQFVEAIQIIAASEHFETVDLFHKKSLSLHKLVKFKRLKDSTSQTYKNYRYPAFIGVPFNPVTDEYPYPTEAINMTYDGLHPSDKGYEVITKMLVKSFKKQSIK
jgi:lysophospholipase L1-like esterase